jgi:hypothetical protein
MVDEVGVVKGLRGYGIKEEFAHAKSATAAMGAENVSTLCQMSKCGEGEGNFGNSEFEMRKLALLRSVSVNLAELRRVLNS